MPSTDPAKLHAKLQRQALRVKHRTLSHYSEGAPACACCGEGRLEFLAIDHIDGRGGRERRALKLASSTQFYRYLERENFPAGYRVLCHNCNSALGWYGYCPHASADQAAKTLAMLDPRLTGRPRRVAFNDISLKGLP
jgi:hypothetical protein